MAYAASLGFHDDDEPAHLGSTRILFCGKSFIADPTGALYWPAEQTLIVSDLNLERGSYLAEERALLPPYDMRSVFDKLEEAIDRHDPERVIALGDSVAPGANRQNRMSIHDAEWLEELMDDREWYWVTGAQDLALPQGIAGVICPHVSLGGIRFRYEPLRAPVTHEISGRMHPVARVLQYGHPMEARCFVSNGMRLILPSMGRYSAGQNVLNPAFEPLLGNNGLFVWALAHGQVFPVAAGQLQEADPAAVA